MTFGCVNTICISHGHNDHTGGLKPFFNTFQNNDIEVVAHPDAFKKKICDNLDISSPLSYNELTKLCKLSLTKEPRKISNNIVFLGEIPSLNDFENRILIGKQEICGSFEDDFVLDDSALAYQASNGIYVITGCSHSGICNIIEYAKQVCNDTRILGVIGGFHLFDVNTQVRETINYFKENNIKELYPCHCTSFAVKAEINNAIPIKEVGVGLQIEW